MAWLELHDTIRDHHKTYALADMLKIEDAHAVGLVCCLWAWACRNAVDGVLSIPNRAIAEAAKWHITKQADKFVGALVACGWIDETGDGRYIIHDWDEYAALLKDNYKRNKEQTRKRVERYRERKRTGTEADVTDTNSGNVTVVTRYGNACNAPTIPYHTLPNQSSSVGNARAHEDTGETDDDHDDFLDDLAAKAVHRNLEISEVEAAAKGYGLPFAAKHHDMANLMLTDCPKEWVLAAIEKAGMDEAALSALHARLLNNEAERLRGIEHIALVNIQRRIASYYGAGGRMAVQSKAGAGTTVTVLLPAQP